ncbi:twitching motility protein PilT [Thermosyntropha lipolytica DSM 11003]|uniref:Twitching motility protein PilT n=1 Tax=Thermosyntropha lipolytica DSM 11003 TaxID=1123382 RepID=A0A1M5LMU4_9FIRM|nr:type IV pilus twitching motility protein PilT [Thermosyntropha lipolytica]SHG66381.1 twitching motility protein PilT [Thermosyntropha lipolytica DSM 11003]
MLTAREIITRAVEIGASDVHLTVFRPPVYRINGKLTSLPGEELLKPEDTQRMAEEIIPNEEVRFLFKQNGQVDFSNAFPGIGRFRVNLYVQRGSIAAAIRIIPMQVPHIDDLGLPPVVKEFAMKDTGLVLVTGVTGSGKSTTLAAMIDLMNRTRSLHILTLEDPIEYLHRHGGCMINQREIGMDARSFPQALRAALRQDPDVIMVGEMRDLETISTAITAAETGHLVLASLHSGSATQTIARIIDVFPPEQQTQIRIQLANSLQGVISQQLIPRSDYKGRVVACEILVATPAVRNLIRENKVHQIYSVLQTGAAYGMITMEKSLRNLYEKGIISLDEFNKRMAGKDNQLL